jgi:phage shock protein C
MRPSKKLFSSGLYRSRRGVLLGVCRGLAEFFDFSVAWTRAIAVGLLLLTGFWPVTGLYLLAALLMKPEPVIPPGSPDETEFYNSYTHSRSGAAQRMKKQYDTLNRRIQRMEDIVTDKEFDWEQRLNT